MLALYRKYRPKSLSEVVGQEKVTNILENSLKSEKISHAYLFTGPRGTGKTSVARIFAHEINNFPYEIEDSYLDIIEIDAASNTGVDNIRELREKAAIAPTKGKYKVYIIDEVHMLSKSAFNALLKTLEEPPEHVVFLLATTDIEKVPITITSRVQIYVFGLASPETMQSHLKSICEKEKIAIDDDALEIIVRRGGGSFRDSLSLLDQISSLGAGNEKITKSLVEKSFGLPADELISAILSAYETSDFSLITERIKDTLNTGTKPETLAEELLKRIIRDPKPAFLPLLEKLPSVKGVFPEAKLLVALLSTSTPVVTPVIGAPTKAPTFSVSTSVSSTTIKTPTSTATSVEAFSAETISENTTPVEPTNAAFDWTSYLDAVKHSSLGAAMWLKKAEFLFDNGTLHLYPPTTAVKGILESANNRQVLLKNLNGFSLTIHEPGEKPKNQQNQSKSGPDLSKISDIMGEIKEVNIDGTDCPF